MPEYIEREALCKHYQDRFEFLKDSSYTMVDGGYRVDDEMQAGAIIAKEFLDRVRQAPTADVVEVVRCKDCKHYRNHPNGLCYAHSEPYGTGYKGETICVEPDDFCSYGERKDVQK